MVQCAISLSFGVKTCIITYHALNINNFLRPRGWPPMSRGWGRSHWEPALISSEPEPGAKSTAPRIAGPGPDGAGPKKAGAGAGAGSVSCSRLEGLE
jgi:hypothetical protein